ncbi:C6 zinc finger domain-containing protein [Purpureocillium lavendulum]|uniref:C6 zinc finger domain-containing protein n=1 Tax=Purpureocillium lavendulum TaxID=1247861 RepID=A0AB34FP51_9HYPO|nr:C6 zinc finger domain-containing protein [Purpureocillium lavendulum]
MLVSRIFVALSAAAVGLAGTPVESGNWVEDKPSYSSQSCAGGSVNGLTFTIPKSPNGDTSGSGCSNGHLRAERRYKDDYTSGVRQFGGTFKINSMSGTRISIKQTFNGDAGPYFIMAVEQGGRLYSVEGGATIATGVATVGASVSINTVHNADNHRFSVYVNGKEAFRDDNAPGGSFYDKIGAYTTNSGTGDMSITWSDVQFWHRT